jgi:hypothetical protein
VVVVGAFAIDGGVAAAVVVVLGLEVPTVEWPQPVRPSDIPLTSATAPIPESTPPTIRTDDDRTGFGLGVVSTGLSGRLVEMKFHATLGFG